jgi:DNA-binding CsgD family transcriptional regulator
VRVKLYGVPVQLAPRELQIVLLALQGKEPQEIAWALELAPGTVWVRIRGICQKIGVANLHEIVIWALQHHKCLRTREVGLSHLHPVGCPCDAPYCRTMRWIAA